MMLSPEEYHDTMLKGKSAEQIRQEILALEQEIRRLEEIVRRPEYLPAICPSEDVQLLCSREYLTQAKRVLAAAEHAERSV